MKVLFYQDMETINLLINQSDFFVVRPLRTIWTRYPHHNHIVVKARRYLQLIRRRQHIGEKTTAGKAS